MSDDIPMSADSSPLLVARGITKRFGGLVAVHEADLVIPKGAIVSLIGPNGAGKTTFFNIVAGITEPSAGEITIDGRKMVARPIRTWLEPVFWFAPSLLAVVVGLIGGAANLPVLPISILVAMVLLIAMLIAAIIRPKRYDEYLIRLGIFRNARPNDMVQAGIGRTFQNIRLFQNMSALDNVLVGMHIQLGSNLVDAVLASRRQAREETAARQRARDLLALVGLRGRGDSLARNLPYGDQRRLEIARALASDPELLLLDEPAAGLNPSETGEMMRLIGRLRSELGKTVLLIEHDMRVVMGVSDRITVLDHGERIAEGTPEEIRRNPRVIEAYLGAPAS